MEHEECSPKKYAKLRESVGSQSFVAKKLGVNVTTISRRETGPEDKAVSLECFYALRFLKLSIQLQSDESADVEEEKVRSH